MAVTWDFILISSCFILNINEKREEKIGIEKMLSIDDWAWTNQREVQGFSDMERKLEEGKIIVIYLSIKLYQIICLYAITLRQLFLKIILCYLFIFHPEIFTKNTLLPFRICV